MMGALTPEKLQAPAEFEPAMPEIERPQHHVFDVAATGIDKNLRYLAKYIE